jgi:hypothetical protein
LGDEQASQTPASSLYWKAEVVSEDENWKSAEVFLA